MISQQHFENFFCCFDHCSLLSQAQLGAVIWARCKYIGRNDEMKAYTKGGRPSWEDRSSTKGDRMACKCALLNEGVPPDQILSTWQEALQSSPGHCQMYSNPACSSLPDQVLDFLQERKAIFTLMLGSESQLTEDECKLTKIVFPCTWILTRLGVKTSGAGLFLTYMESHHCKKRWRWCISTERDTCAAEKKKSCLAVHSAWLENKKQVFSYYWKGNTKWVKLLSFK